MGGEGGGAVKGGGRMEIRENIGAAGDGKIMQTSDIGKRVDKGTMEKEG